MGLIVVRGSAGGVGGHRLVPLADADAVGLAAGGAGGHPSAVAQTSEGAEGSGRRLADGGIRVAHPEPNSGTQHPMPGAGRVLRHHHSSDETARWASRMQAGTPTPSKAAPAIARPGTSAVAAWIAATRAG